MPRDSKRNLVEYFKKNMKKGYDLESLKWALIKQGYSRSLVEDAMEIAKNEISLTAPKSKDRPEITHEIIDPDSVVVEPKRSFWKRLFGGK
jgi:hypothetical protein